MQSSDRLAINASALPNRQYAPLPGGEYWRMDGGEPLGSGDNLSLSRGAMANSRGPMSICLLSHGLSLAFSVAHPSFIHASTGPKRKVIGAPGGRGGKICEYSEQLAGVLVNWVRVVKQVYDSRRESFKFSVNHDGGNYFLTAVYYSDCDWSGASSWCMPRTEPADMVGDLATGAMADGGVSDCVGRDA